MTALAALRLLHDHRAIIRLDGGDLRVTAPAPLPPVVVAAIRTEKAGLVRLLADFPTALDDLDSFEERAAILEFDGGLSRAEAERVAWNDVFGNTGP